MGFHTGIGGTATVNGTEVALTRWSVNNAATIVDFRNSKTGVYAKRKSTYHDADFEVVIDWEDDNNIFAGTLNIAEGATLTNVKLFVDNTAAVGVTPNGDYWHFPSAMVQGTPQTLDRAGRLETTVRCLNDGQYGTPGNPVS